MTVEENGLEHNFTLLAENEEPVVTTQGIDLISVVNFLLQKKPKVNLEQKHHQSQNRK